MYMETIRAPSLTSEEWSAVKIAILDAASRASAAPKVSAARSLFRRLGEALTGNRQSTPLADPRLECLRRFVYTTRRGRRLAEPLVPCMIAQGYNRAQVEAIALLAV